MDLKTLFAEHVRTISRHAEEALSISRIAGHPFDGIVLHAGTQATYHADDHVIPFVPTPHFARFVPVGGPDHLLLFVPGEPPRLVRVVPRDYWYEVPAEPEHPYAEVLDVVQVESAADARAELQDVSHCAYVGSDPATGMALGIPTSGIEPVVLTSVLDWYRGYKTPYEVDCIREANRQAARGHRAVRAGIAQGLSERRLHAAYLEATGLLESEAPYTNIIAWDDRSATLHYQTKRTTAPEPGGTLLIDAGAVQHGYASDITRTYVRDQAHPVFRQALDRVEEMQQRLVGAVAPGVPYLDLHVQAHRDVAGILCDLGILTVDAQTAFERGFTRPFFPHGLGHHLGIQVHDVGGRQTTPQGERRDPPAVYPFLRTTRDLEPGHVVTVEPGLYFIPMLLEPFRESEDARAFDWRLVDALMPCGGIRIEDDVLVTPEGHENLTRPFVPGHRDS
jgi:Xaa-Pro dipeptidase